jgi:hypothetical protein
MFIKRNFVCVKFNILYIKLKLGNQLSIPVSESTIEIPKVFLVVTEKIEQEIYPQYVWIFHMGEKERKSLRFRTIL